MFELWPSGWNLTLAFFPLGGVTIKVMSCGRPERRRQRTSERRQDKEKEDAERSRTK
jgi:hypothetical protein